MAGAKNYAILARLNSNAHVSGQRVFSDLVSKGNTIIPKSKSFAEGRRFTHK
jgi:hypothetical protein